MLLEGKTLKMQVLGDKLFEDDHVSGGNHVSEGGPSEGEASKGNLAFDGDHDSKSGTSEGRASEDDQTFEDGISEGSGSKRGPEVNNGRAFGGSQSSEESPEGDVVPELEGDSEQVQRPHRVRNIPRRFVEFDKLQDTEGTLRYKVLFPSGVRSDAELICYPKFD